MDNFDFGSILSLLITWGAVGFIFVVVNFLLLRDTIHTQNREKTTLTWSTTEGTITTSKVRKQHDTENGNVSYPRVTYTYEVDGKKHHSSNIMAGGEIGGINVESTLARYPLGLKVTVYYDPQNPKDAVLEPGNTTFSKGMWLMIALVKIFVCGMGLYLTYSTLK